MMSVRALLGLMSGTLGCCIGALGGCASDPCDCSSLPILLGTHEVTAVTGGVGTSGPFEPAGATVEVGEQSVIVRYKRGNADLKVSYGVLRKND